MSREEENPKTPQRITRSSTGSLSSPSPSKTPSQPKTKPKPKSKPTPIPKSPLSLDHLLSALPSRRSQIQTLLGLLGPDPNSPTLPILIYGAHSVAKTTTILQTLTHLRRPFAYASLRSCRSPKSLFHSILNQLSPDAAASAAKCERPSDFLALVSERLANWSETVYLVFDNVELARSWDKNSGFVSFLFRIGDLLKIPYLGLVYISSSSPDTYYSSFGSVEPVEVYFPDYTVEDLHGIFMRNRENPQLYSSFLSVVLKPFCRVTRRVDELAVAFEPLFQKYCEPLSDLGVVPDEGTKRRLFDNIQRHLAASLNDIFTVAAWSSVEGKEMGSGSRRSSVRRAGDGRDSNELDFHMSMSAKYLLISAFLASRNPATLDAALFDSTGGSGSQKRKRKSSQTSMDENDSMAQELLMKGPGTFPLERMLAIFQCITSVGEGTFGEEQLEAGVATEGGSIGLMSDVLLQLSTLCNANFICKSGSCPLEGSIRYRSMVDEEIALKVARSINFPLSKYLYRR